MAKKRAAPIVQRPAAGKWTAAIPWVALFCATLAAYWPALQGALLWDDPSHVTKPELQSWHGLWQIWFDLGATQQYYPLLHSAFWLEHRVWGDAVLGYHLVNVLLHCACACLVVLLARRLSLTGAWLAGFVFALHPVCVEAVAWISEQKSTLSAFFYLASALVYLDYDRSRRLSRYLPALGLFVLALASKTVTATLPATLLVIFWWRRGRIEWKRDVAPLLPWFAIGITAGLFTAWVEKTYIGATGEVFRLTILQRFLLAGRAIWFYAAKLLWPVNLTFTYPRWNLDPGQWWQYLFPAAALAAALGLVFLARRRRGPLAAFLIFCGTLFPALGFFDVYPFRFSFVADHFQYLASLGLIVPLCSALAMLAHRIPLSGAGFSPGALWAGTSVPPGRLADSSLPQTKVSPTGTSSHIRGPGSVACAGVLVTILGAMTWSQSGIYRDPETLYRETLRRNPDSWLAHNNLGNLLQSKPGQLNEAIAELEAAVRLSPDSELPHSNLGSALAQAGRLNEAVSQLETAVRIRPDYAKAHSNLGGALAQMPGGLSRAVAEFQTAIRIDPDFAEAHYNLGNVLMQIPDRQPEAIVQYQEAIRIEPDYLAAHTNLGGLWAEGGKLADAVAEYQACLRIDPQFAEGHYNLASVLVQIPGRVPDAIAEYREAIRIRPDYLDAHTDLGSALAELPGRMPDAVAEFRAALRLAPDFAEGHYNLGNALVEIPGGQPEAIAEFETALRLKPDFEPARQKLRQLGKAAR